MLIGKTAGTIGETSVIAILIGAIILIMLGVISARIPGAYIVTFEIFVFIFGADPFNPTYVVAQLCGGGLMLGAFFMATDYVTSPITPKGQIILVFLWIINRNFPLLWSKCRRYLMQLF